MTKAPSVMAAVAAVPALWVSLVADALAYPGVPDLSITEVWVDVENEHLLITGRDFDAGSTLRVELGELGDITAYCLADLISDPQQIDCDFSSNGLPADGDYLLTVTATKRRWVYRGWSVYSDEYDLTIPAVGLACAANEVLLGAGGNAGIVTISALEERTEGWIAGLRFAVQAVRATGSDLGSVAGIGPP